jgi:hypothetical protein
MDAAAAAACGFTHDSYAGLRGYGPGPDGMPPSVYGPGEFFSFKKERKKKKHCTKWVDRSESSLPTLCKRRNNGESNRVEMGNSLFPSFIIITVSR